MLQENVYQQLLVNSQVCYAAVYIGNDNIKKMIERARLVIRNRAPESCPLLSYWSCCMTLSKVIV